MSEYQLKLAKLAHKNPKLKNRYADYLKFVFDEGLKIIQKDNDKVRNLPDLTQSER